MSGSSRPLPLARLAVAGAVLVGLGGVLMLDAYADGAFRPPGGGSKAVGSATVPPAIRQGGPVIDAVDPAPVTYRLPPRTIALTFDDGPDPTWTPAVLRVLEQQRVPATFFVLGTQVVRHPELARRILAEGHEVGLHTFTHPDLSRVDGWRWDLELSAAQLALAGATGRTTPLFRQPYSSTADAIDDPSWAMIRYASRRGYLSVVADSDTRDWIEKDAGTVARNGRPGAGAGTGAVVLWHDAGGDRSSTVEGLARYIRMMRDEGYRFTTVTEGLATPMPADGDPSGGAVAAGQPSPARMGSLPAPRHMVFRGVLLGQAVRAAGWIVDLLWWVFVGIGLLTVVRTLVSAGFACHHAWRRRRPDWTWGPPVGDPVTVVVPAFNEEKGIVAAVRSLALGDHPTIEVIVVDDGSTDATADLAEALGLPNVRVLRRDNGGKPAALNAGVRAATHDLIVMVDGDTVFEPDSIRHLVQPFADPRVGAVSGNVKIGNRTTMVARWQHLEYVVGFNLDRRLYDTLRCMPTVPGAIGAFRRSALADVGGVSHDTLAEDTDLTMALCRAGWRVVYQERARAWTEAPTTLRQLWRQRYRWCYGTMQAMWKHRSALRDRSLFGVLGLPLLALFGVVMPLFAPLFDILAVYGALVLDPRTTVLAWFGMLAVQIATAGLACWLDGESPRPLWSLPWQQLVYRQTMYLVALQSVITAFTGVRLRWHKLRRTGLRLGNAPGSGRCAGSPTGAADGAVAARTQDLSGRAF